MVNKKSESESVEQSENLRIAGIEIVLKRLSHDN